jgi:alanine racemase
MLPSSALPRAVISRSALTAAAAVAAAAGGRIADLRHDAWGHGILAVAQAARAAGIDRVLVDSPSEAEALSLEGIDAVVGVTPDVDSMLLYGLPDADGVLASQPVMRLSGRVMSTKQLNPGDAVSYGYTHRASEHTVVALVTGGYAQGIVRALGNNAHVEVEGVERPIIGRVAMDVCVVDLQGHEAPVGADVTYFGGRGPAAPALARWSVVTGLTVAELVAVAGAHAQREWEE